MIAALLLLTFGVLVFLLEVPIAFALGLASFTVLLVKGIPLTVVPQMMFSAIDSFSLLAIPLFILAGELMGTGGITRRLIKFLTCMVGYVRGGLALVNVAASMIFAGISGTATADTAALGSILIPGMIDEGYDRDFSAAVTASSSTIGIVIPPSVPMVVLGTLLETSVVNLFIGGIIPGIMVGLGLMAVAYVISCKRQYPRHERVCLKDILESTKEALPALVMPVMVLGGILGGVFSVTEAACVAVVYAFVVGRFLYRELRFSELFSIVKRAAGTTAAVMLVIASANSFAWLLASERIPQTVAQLLFSMSGGNRLAVLMAINLVVLGLGTVLDGISMLIILVPVLLPVVKMLGISLTHFAIIMVLGVGIGQQTPPVGACLYLTSSLAGIGILDTARANVWFVAVLFATLILVTLFPGLSTWLPTVFAR